MNKYLSPAIRAFEQDHVWVSQHLERLLERYSDQWIAVKDGKVIASDPDVLTLNARLPNPAHTCIEFVTREPLEMIL